jgi:excisionase family DNA binding protein
MGAVKRIPKDWRTQNTKGTRAGLRTRASFDSLEVHKSEDLPELMSTKEAAVFLRRHYKTVEEYRHDGSLKFMKSRGRYFTTPEWIAEFLENESKK